MRFLRFPRDVGEWALAVAAAAILATMVFAVMATLEPAPSGVTRAQPTRIVLPIPKPGRIIPL